MTSYFDDSSPFDAAPEIPDDSLQTPRIVTYCADKGKMRHAIREGHPKVEESAPFYLNGPIESKDSYTALVPGKVELILLPKFCLYFFGKRAQDHSLVEAYKNDPRKDFVMNQVLATALVKLPNGEWVPTLSSFIAGRSRGVADALRKLKDKQSYDEGNKKIPFLARFVTDLSFRMQPKKKGDGTYQATAFNGLRETTAEEQKMLLKPSASQQTALDAIVQTFEAEKAKIEALYKD